MHAFAYERPATLAEAIGLLEAHGSRASLLAGGTDLIIGLRDGTQTPAVVIDVKRIAELCPGIRDDGDRVTIGATTVMTELADSELIRSRYRALAEAASVVGSVQIRNRATMPATSGRTGAVHLRQSRRRGHDLASVTLCCAVNEAAVTRIAYGSVGPRPLLRIDESGVLADAAGDDTAKAAILERMFAAAAPSRNSMRASPEYRLAMLRVLGTRGVRIAIDRLAQK
jgi:CO/xanthine dehydrogenase FAD-binding subunit